MKRFIPVLAIVLILILTAWDNASSRRYPAIRIDEPVYDHPWGGEQNNPDPPVTYITSSSNKNELTIIGIFKKLNHRFFFNGSTFFIIGSQGTTTTTIPTTEPSTDTNPSTDQGGWGQ